VSRDDVELVRLGLLVVVAAETCSSKGADLVVFVEIDDVQRARFRGMTISLIVSSLVFTVLELELLEVVLAPADAFEGVGEGFVDLDERVLVNKPSGRPPYEVPHETDAKEREELVEIVEAFRVDGGTGAEGLGGNETEGMSLRDLALVVDGTAAATFWLRSPLFGGP
jgi:hypothetical protein